MGVSRDHLDRYLFSCSRAVGLEQWLGFRGLGEVPWLWGSYGVIRITV